MKRPIKAAKIVLPLEAARTVSRKLSDRATQHEGSARAAARKQAEDAERARTRALNAHIRARRAAKKIGATAQVEEHHERVLAHRKALAGAKPEEQSE